MDDLYYLNCFAVAVRYPGESTTAEEARESVERMEKILNALRSLLPEDR